MQPGNRRRKPLRDPRRRGRESRPVFQHESGRYPCKVASTAAHLLGGEAAGPGRPWRVSGPPHRRCGRSRRPAATASAAVAGAPPGLVLQIPQIRGEARIVQPPAGEPGGEQAEKPRLYTRRVCAEAMRGPRARWLRGSGAGTLTVPEHPRLLPRFLQSPRCPLIGPAGLARRRRVQLLSGQDFSYGQDLDAGMLAPR